MTNMLNSISVHSSFLKSSLIFLICEGFFILFSGEINFGYLFWNILFLVPLLCLYCNHFPNKGEAIIVLYK